MSAISVDLRERILKALKLEPSSFKVAEGFSVSERPHATLNELREQYGDKVGIYVSETTMWRSLQRMGFTL